MLPRRAAAVCLGVAGFSALQPHPPAALAHGNQPAVTAPLTLSVKTLKGNRSYQEDRWRTTKDGRVLAVFDGHGGSDVSQCLWEQLFIQVQTELHGWKGEEGDGSGTERLRRAVLAAFEAVEAHVLNTPQWDQQGSTAAVAFILAPRSSDDDAVDMAVGDGAAAAWLPTADSQAGTIMTANVGDSRVVLSRHGRAVELTRDHKPNCEQERARIERLGGSVEFDGYVDKFKQPIENTGVYRVNGNLAVARAVGDASDKPFISAEPEIHVEPLQGGEQFVIVASDGLWDVMSSDEAVAYVHAVMSDSVGALREAKNSQLERAAQMRIWDWTARHPDSDRDMVRAALASRKQKMSRYLAEEALRRGTEDNTTVLVVWLQ